ncbi:hypothetical protein A6122_0698 [Rathayibacter tritici]|uniref:Uncharacterized protein n=1 Tax=Rathayibacter tritici TaxID=33888 RepID=A0A169BV40_9MICO|nr:hypothetical protein A6122_0698 [Rathayibacter tritici]
MLSDPGRPQALPRAHPERRDRVGTETEQRRGVGGSQALDLRVPEHLLPARRQRPECAGAEIALQRRECALLRVRAGSEEGMVVLVERSLPPAPARPGAGDVADRGEEVRAEGALGAASALDHPQHAKERLRDQVIGVRAARPGTGDRTSGAGMTAPQLGDGVGASAAHEREQFGIAQTIDALGAASKTHSHAPSPAPRRSCPSDRRTAATCRRWVARLPRHPSRLLEWARRDWRLDG